MGLLAWLGLKQGGSFPNLDALLTELRAALPDDEAVVLRYIATVIVLLGKVAAPKIPFAIVRAVAAALFAVIGVLALLGIDLF